MKVEDEVYMIKPYSFIAKGQEHMVCKLYRSIFRLNQASRSWNIRFDQVIKSFIMEQNTGEPCVYKKCERSVVIFLILYVDDILLIGNDIGALSTIKIWLANYFDMKDLGEASYILGKKVLRDHQNKMLVLSQERVLSSLQYITPRKSHDLSSMKFLCLRNNIL